MERDTGNRARIGQGIRPKDQGAIQDNQSQRHEFHAFISLDMQEAVRSNASRNPEEVRTSCSTCRPASTVRPVGSIAPSTATVTHAREDSRREGGRERGREREGESERGERPPLVQIY